MGVSPITPAALLVPALVKLVQTGLGPRRCGAQGVGKLRRDFRAMGDLPTIAAAEQVLCGCCRACGKCNMARR
jgi:hypothetical protein